MTTKSYSDKLKDPRWQKKRLEIMERDQWTCKGCKSKDKQLQVHHLKYGKTPWDIENNCLITLCEHCHEIVQSLQNEISNVIVECFSDVEDDGAVNRASYILSMIKVSLHSFRNTEEEIDFDSCTKLSVDMLNNVFNSGIELGEMSGWQRGYDYAEKKAKE